MSARDKTRSFTKQSDEGLSGEVLSDVTAFFESKPDHEKELAAASQRFAAVLRTAPVETTKTGLRDIRHAPFSGDERPLWTTTFESEWHRYIAKPIKASTIH